MMFWFLIVFIALPWIELSLLFRVGQIIGGGATLGLIILTGIIGASLTRLEGARALATIRQSSARGEVPGRAIVDAVLIFAAGLVLITPGFLTDIAGFLLLTPPVRALIRSLLLRQLKNRAVYHINTQTRHQQRPHSSERQSPPDPDVIDVEGREVFESEDKK